MCCASCLVTSTPDFEEPEQTPPELIATSALPDLRRVLIAEPGSRQSFSATVRSTEDAGETIKVRLYIDYGIARTNGGPPWSGLSFAPDLQPASGDETRLATADWIPEELGCHTATLIVSHAFDEGTQCPEEIADSSQLTWLVHVCAPGTCEDLDLQTCPVVTDACPDDADGTTSSTGAAP